MKVFFYSMFVGFFVIGFLVGLFNSKNPLALGFVQISALFAIAGALA